MLAGNLYKLGFSPSETKIYLHLVHSGCSYPNEISAKTKINRTNVYEALERLIAKGVVSFVVRNNIKWFEAEKPDTLLRIIEGRETELATTKVEIMNEVKKISKLEKPSLEANIFVGKKGLRLIFEEILNERKDVSILASRMQLSKILGPYFELWHKRRSELGIKQRSIFENKYKSKLKKRDLLTYKFIRGKFMNPTTTIIYGNVCILIQWSKEPVMIKIRNKEIVRSHLNYFNMIWNN